MTCPSALLACSITFLVAFPCSGEERCLAGPVGPRDLDYLAACRPAPVSAAQQEAILRTLPEQGAVTTLASDELAKLETLGRVMRFHARDAVYDVKVIDVPQAWMGLHGRAVLLISLPALRLLRPEQLQALVAHEIAHEYWWDVWEAARRRDDRVRLRSLEGLCDAVAALTLTALGIPAEQLSSALGAVDDFNRRWFPIPGNDANYPTLRERRDIVKRFSTANRNRGQTRHVASDPAATGIPRSLFDRHEKRAAGKGRPDVTGLLPAAVRRPPLAGIVWLPRTSCNDEVKRRGATRDHRRERTY